MSNNKEVVKETTGYCNDEQMDSFAEGVFFSFGIFHDKSKPNNQMSRTRQVIIRTKQADGELKAEAEFLDKQIHESTAEIAGLVNDNDAMKKKLEAVREYAEKLILPDIIVRTANNELKALDVVGKYIKAILDGKE